jgi:hypothetical protein
MGISTKKALEQSPNIQYVGVRPIFEAEGLNRLTITDAVEATGQTESEIHDTSLYFRLGLTDGEQDATNKIVPAEMRSESGGSVVDGRQSQQWRSIQVTSKRGETPSYSITLPDKLLTTIGIDPDDCVGEPIELWAGSRMITFDRTEAASIDIPNSINILDYLLPAETATDYRRVVIENKSVADVAAQRDLDIADESDWDAEQAIRRNVDEAKATIESLLPD